jgi:hypothetical protein
MGRKTNELWRIDDIYTPTEHFSLSRELKKEIKEMQWFYLKKGELLLQNTFKTSLMRMN